MTAEIAVGPIKKKKRRWQRWAVAGVVAVGLITGALAWMSRYRPEALPDPNGYDDLVAAAAEVKGDLMKGSAANTPTEELRAFVGSNRRALEKARVGLGRESRVPLPARPTSKDVERVNQRVGSLRRLGRLLQADAVLADRDGRAADAARGWRDEIRLGRAMIPGGLFNDRLVGRVCEEQGAEGLARLVEKLSAAEARALAAEVEGLETGHEPLSRMVARDEAFMVAWQGMPARLVLLVNGASLRTLRRPAENAADLADRRTSAKLRALAALLALRAWSLDHPGAPRPASLAALVPGDLKAVPADPFGKGALRLKYIDDIAVVYSVGPDGRDDGGQPLGKPAPGPDPPPGDVTLSR